MLKEIQEPQVHKVFKEPDLVHKELKVLRDQQEQQDHREHKEVKERKDL